MHIIDLHIHSKYSRACSRDLELENINLWCKLKGIDVVATGDFTHPAWFRDIKSKLEPAEEGLFRLRKGVEPTVSVPIKVDPAREVRFLLATEVSCIYSKGGKTRRLHIVILAPDIAAVEKINSALSKLGKLASDGRPILGLDAKRLAEIVFAADRKCMVIPAHAWTPWFSVFGSKSGFDSLEECFDELAGEIYAIETGLSSDPPMNWRLKKLDKVALISNSDAHSLDNLGREANVFEFEKGELSCGAIFAAIKSRDKKKFLRTIEFYPEEGMYHVDGHRGCGVSLSPGETKKLGGVCPKCKKSLTIGVMHRVDDLADRNEKDINENNFIPYERIIPLKEIIAECFGKGKKTKTVGAEYFKIIEACGNEFAALRSASFDELKKVCDPRVALGIKNTREGAVEITPGFDGVYGSVRFLKSGSSRDKQKKLF